ncbi:MAG: efflux RND transporter periplasmic adaptor subunit [Acidobacteriota bacterium]
MKIIDVFNINEKKGKVVWLTIFLLILIVIGFYYFFIRKTGTSEYTTAQVSRGNLINKVSSTGTLQAVTTVLVGSQASGTISALYVDFNSVVHKGEVIAELDPASLQAQVEQAKSNLEQSKAAYQVALANLANARAQLSAAKSNILNQTAGVSSARGNLNSLKAQTDDALSLLNKQKTLFSEGIIAERDLEVAQTGYNTAVAKYQQADAQVNQARVTEQSAKNSGIEQANATVRQMESQIQAANAQIGQNTAALKLAQINLRHTTITSPINGTVVARDVDVGQTVAASLSAPTLFSIANDLTQMQVLANIDEADIGSINQTDKVSFGVDAFPGQNFSGTIKQIRLNAQTVSNVVTYNVVISVSNPDQKLLPGMTANLTFVIAERDNVLKIPNSAFRYVPQTGRSQRTGNSPANQTPNSPNAAENQDGDQTQVSPPTSPVLPGQTRIVWTLDENKRPLRHKIKIGITDGAATEVVEGDLNEGDSVITAETASGGTRTSNTQSAPGFGGGGRPPGR